MDYYIKYTGKVYELRQTKFKGKLHPHDLCAVAADMPTLLGIYDKYLVGGIEGHRDFNPNDKKES